MKPPLIGILGCGGAVGRAACEVLEQSYRIRGGQRSLPQNLNKDKFEWVMVDLYDPELLSDFCRGCDVILNCAGPSYRIGDCVALAAAESGACYVDAFGADPLEKALLESMAGADGVFVISAGSFPGLSGLLPRWLFAQGFETAEEMHAFAGGREYCTDGACADILLSSVSGFGIPGAFLRNGSLIRNAEDFHGKVYLPGFKEEAYVQRFLNSEAVRLAEKLKLQEVHCYNVVAEKQVSDILSRSCARLAMNNSDAVLKEEMSKVSAAASMALSGGSAWYTIMVELHGRTQGKAVRKRVVLHSSNSYRLSGVVAAAAVEAVLEHGLANGVYWAFDVLNPFRVMEKLFEAKAAKSFGVVDIPPVRDNIILGEMEEGML